MKLSRESEDGLAGVLYLARQPAGTILQVGAVAEGCGLARPFLAKIFVRLARGGVLRSFRGRERGYALSRPPGEINVKEVVQAIEGPEIFQRCIFWSNACSDTNPCVLHPVWRTARPLVAELLARTTLADLAAGHQPPNLRDLLAGVQPGPVLQQRDPGPENSAGG
jgi:Rrf2 family iron-sulfur cluster assembly transcriptional regulator